MIRFDVLGFLLLLFLLLAVAPAGATYAGDRTFAVVETGTVHGEIVETLGTSVYSGAVATDGTYAVDLPVTLPEGATVKSARLSAYWTWSHAGSTGVLPDLSATLDGSALSGGTRYSDRKGSGTYDYPYGLDAWNVTDRIASGSHHVVLTNRGVGTEVSFYGVALLLVVETPQGTARQYWIHEGTDLLYNTTGVSTEQATTRIQYGGVPALSGIQAATLLSVIPGADKGDLNKNEVFFNGRSLGPVDAPSSQVQVAVNTTNVLPYLQAGSNELAVRDKGDSMMPGTFVLTVDLMPGPTFVAIPPLTALPRDLDGDGICEDVNGNGRTDFNDITVFFNSMAWIAEHEPIAAFDPNRNGRIDFNDVVVLFNRL
jgi:PKD repeat protein